MTTAAAAVQPPGVAPNILRVIDMTTLSQSELQFLSLSTTTTTTTTNTRTPASSIDRTSFNESAGSRRQTYSRSSPHLHHHHRHRLSGLLPKTPNPNPNPTTTDPENQSIVKFLKQFLSTHPEFEQQQQQLDLFDLNSLAHFDVNYNNALTGPPPALPERKRKRGRKPKSKIVGVEEGALVNNNGVVVDLERLQTLEHPYMEELRRRTCGLQNENELLGFFTSVGGEWCSKRKKRKVVDASSFGDLLPVGWKIVLALKRKEGRAWVYCRRYISPSGKHFLSCKEVAAYLKSFFGLNRAARGENHTDGVVDHVVQLGAAIRAGGNANAGADQQKQYNGLGKELVLLENENLADVQIRDLFECQKCGMKFDDKETYLHHLLSFHQMSVGKSHAGDGVRNHVATIEESSAVQMAQQLGSGSPKTGEVATRTSKMDALIEIAQSSMHETPSLRPSNESNVGVTHNGESAIHVALAAPVSKKLDSDSPISGAEIADRNVKNPLESELHQPNTNYMKAHDDLGDINFKMDSSYENVQHGNKSEVLCGAIINNSGPCEGNERKGVGIASDDHFPDGSFDGIIEASLLQLHHSNGSTTPIASLDTTIEINQKHDNVMEFDELEMQDIEGAKFCFGTGETLESLHEVSIVVDNDNDIEVVYGASTQFGVQVPDLGGGQQLTTVCVWCGLEFCHEAFDTEPTSDSVGYMCPTCKSRISGQFGV